MIQQAIADRRPGRSSTSPSAATGTRARSTSRPRRAALFERRARAPRGHRRHRSLAYGPMVKTCLEAAQAAEEEGSSSRSSTCARCRPLDVDTIVASVREDRPAGRRPRGVDVPRHGRRDRGARSPSGLLLASRRRCCGSAATTCPTRRAGSRRSSSPTSTACSTPSTAPRLLTSLLRQGEFSQMALSRVQAPRPRRGPHRGRDRHLAGQAVGDTVKVNDIVVEIETAKSLVELPVPVRRHGDRAARRRGRHGRGRHPDHLGRRRRPGGRHGCQRTAPRRPRSTRHRRAPAPSDPSAGARTIEREGMIGGTTSTGRTAVLVGYGVKQTEAKRRPRKAGAATEHVPTHDPDEFVPSADVALGDRTARAPRAAQPVVGREPASRSGPGQAAGAQAGQGPRRRPRQVTAVRRGWRRHPRRRRGPRLGRRPTNGTAAPRLPVRRRRASERRGSRSRACAR